MHAEVLLSQFLAVAGRSREAIAIQTGIVAADARRHVFRPTDTRALRDVSFSRKVLGSLYWDSGDRARACAVWRESNAGFSSLEGEGRLNEWDRDNVVKGLRTDFARCGAA